MDLDLPQEHQLLRQTVRDFMAKEVAGQVDEHERERRFPTDIVKRMGELGWLGIPIPEDEGGAGLDYLAYAITVEEISRVWGSLGIIVAAHTSLGCGPLHLAGTKAQKVVSAPTIEKLHCVQLPTDTEITAVSYNVKSLVQTSKRVIAGMIARVAIRRRVSQCVRPV